MLSDSGVSGTFVAINAGAGWVTKRWVPAYFAQVVDSLASAGVASVLVGGKAPADISAANEVLAECKNKPISLLGQTSVRELVALVDLSAAHLGGDTGTTHLAAALNKPAVGLYSITKPLRTCPYGQIDRCCYEPSGLGEIKPEAVLVHLKEALG
jgi:ADP-heptose:LPS heptosyltransferase